MRCLKVLLFIKDLGEALASIIVNFLLFCLKIECKRDSLEMLRYSIDIFKCPPLFKFD